MHPDELYKALHRQPFAAFRLHISDGATYDVRHPEMLLLTRHAAYIGVAGEGAIPEHADIVALLHISRLEELPAGTSASNGNGAQGT